MAWLSKLLGGSKPAAEATPAETHKGFSIVPSPTKEGGGYRIGAQITKDVDGQTRAHQLIRADTVGDYDEACKMSLAKAKQVIDEQGDEIFR
ncbi:HlyU family transcriptional regulator [Yoonia sp. 208BN28-4]|uniref:HlyU family transcriptional regulator n=1 Tax=Yoonia sp. 208BN28-4 TaxID=3126505 RepID=UPI0030A95D29